MYGRHQVRLILLFILLVALGLRVQDHDWDQDQHLHVDEDNVTLAAIQRLQLPPGLTLDDLLNPQRSPLNPRMIYVFPYGALPLYLLRGVSWGEVHISGNTYFNGYEGAQQTGRILSAVSDTVTVLCVFALGLRLWGSTAGLLAAALYTLGILPIQIAHFIIVEPFMTLFMTAALLGSVLFYQTGRVRFLALAGLCVGFGLACKISAAPVGVIPIAAVLLREGPARQWRRLGTLAALSLGMTGLGLLVGDPYAVLDWSTYAVYLGRQVAIQSGAWDMWWTRRYVGTLPVIFPGAHLILLGVGPLVGLAGIAGIGVVIMRIWRQRRGAESLLLVGAGAYFMQIVPVEAKWVRYLLPLVPYLCLFAVIFGFWLASFGRRRQVEPLWRGVLLGSLVISALLGTLAFSAIYQQDHTVVRASRWIYTNIPPGKHLGLEFGDNVLPLPLPEYSAPNKKYVQDIYDMLADYPSPEAATRLRSHLESVDYLIIANTKVSRTLPHQAWRYPVQQRAYDLLFQERLGFRLIYKATSYPQLFGVEFPDDRGWLDISFTEYDHPPVYVFHKERDLSDAEWNALFGEAIQQPAIPQRYAP